MKLSFRWYGEDDKVTLENIRQIPGMQSIVTAVYDVPVGEVWSRESIARLKKQVEDAGLGFDVIESIPVHEDIKLGKDTRDKYIANYCENYCIYCGFNCYNHIKRMKLNAEQIEHEMRVIADSGMEEVLLLTGESRSMSGVEYIGEACKLARKYFRMVGLEIYPVNSDEYRYLRACGADYVTVFQETYDPDKYETLHLMGHKRVWPYRFEAQERAMVGGMRGVGFSALLGLADFRKDALATGLHVYYLQRKYPHAEMSLSCPRLRPIINNDRINPRDVHERQLCQVLCAYRIFLPFAGITVSSRESAEFRNGIVKIAATKVSAGVSTGIGDHESKYTGQESGGAEGDEQFEINDGRSFAKMYDDMSAEGLQPVLNDYLYV